MNERLMGHLRGFENRYPYKLEDKFARIVERIAELWDNAQIDSYFAELMIDQRGNRVGFPPEIAREIFLLSIAHDEIRNKRREETDVWAEEREAAQRAIDELKMKFLPSHMLKAAESSDPSRIALFIKAGMAVDVRDEREWTPLMVAAFNGNEAVARLLITHGANVQARDVGGYTPLHWAALNGFESVIRLLISKGIERNSRSNFGWTALMQAATKGHIAIVRALLDAGDDPKWRPKTDGQRYTRRWPIIILKRSNYCSQQVRRLLHGTRTDQRRFHLRKPVGIRNSSISCAMELKLACLKVSRRRERTRINDVGRS